MCVFICIYICTLSSSLSSTSLRAHTCIKHRARNVAVAPCPSSSSSSSRYFLRDTPPRVVGWKLSRRPPPPRCRRDDFVVRFPAKYSHCPPGDRCCVRVVCTGFRFGPDWIFFRGGERREETPVNVTCLVIHAIRTSYLPRGGGG